MLSSKRIKITLALIASFAAACGVWQSKTEVVPPPFAAEELKSDVPFSTREPDDYQAEIVVSSSGIEATTFIAKRGANRLTIFDYRKNSEFAVVKFGDGKTIFLNRARKIYAEDEATNESGAESPTDFLTADLLNQTRSAKFERLGAENNLMKYLVLLDDAANSEIVVAVDERIGLPVKQEFYAVAGERKNLTMTIELKNFSAPADAKLFEVPKDYRKVAAKEFQAVLRGAQN